MKNYRVVSFQASLVAFTVTIIFSIMISAIADYKFSNAVTFFSFGNKILEIPELPLGFLSPVMMIVTFGLRYYFRVMSDVIREKEENEYFHTYWVIGTYIASIILAGVMMILSLLQFLFDPAHGFLETIIETIPWGVCTFILLIALSSVVPFVFASFEWFSKLFKR